MVPEKNKLHKLCHHYITRALRFHVPLYLKPSKKRNHRNKLEALVGHHLVSVSVSLKVS